MCDGYIWVNHPIMCVLHESTVNVTRRCSIQVTTHNFGRDCPTFEMQVDKTPQITIFQLHTADCVPTRHLHRLDLRQAYKPQNMINRLALDEPITHKGPLIIRVVLTEGCIK